VSEAEAAIDTCAQCGEAFVSHGYTARTLVSSSSPPGHEHDPNCIGRTYRCAHGHMTVVSLRRTCPVCDWTGPSDCFCHPGAKVDRWPAGDIEARREP
jgi:hypothetical protein